MNKTDLSIIRNLTSEEVTADFLNSESVNQVLYKLFAFYCRKFNDCFYNYYYFLFY